MKIYSNDAMLPYKTTKLRARDSKSDIDAILAKYGIFDIAWTYNPENFQGTRLQFQFSENFQDIEINPVVELRPPIVWKPKRRNKPDEIDAKISMRLFYWYIKNALAWTYANQSEKVVAFLPYIKTSKNQTLKDIIVPRLDDLKNLKALPNKEPRNIIDAEIIKET